MTEHDRRATDRVWDRYREMVPLLSDASVPILAGTDQAPDGASQPPWRPPIACR